MFYTGFGDSSINFVLRFWVESSQHAWLAARSAAIKAVKVAFDDAGMDHPADDESGAEPDDAPRG